MKTKKNCLQRNAFIITVAFVLFFLSQNAFSSEYTMRISFGAPGKYSGGQAGFIIKEELEKRSEGRIKVEYYHSGQMGGELEQLDKLRMGTLQAAITSSVVTSTLVPRIAALNLPFLFKNYDYVDKFATSDLKNGLFDDYKKVNLLALDCNGYGFLTLSTKTKPIRKLEDLKGTKFRAPTSGIVLDIFNALGTTATAISFTELHSALEQGVIDGADLSFEAMRFAKMDEILKHYTKSYHYYGWWLLVLNKKWFDSLPDDLKKIVEETVHYAATETRKLARDYDAKFSEEFKTSGGEVIELSNAERIKWVEATKKVHEKYRDIVGQEYIEKLYKLLDYEK